MEIDRSIRSADNKIVAGLAVAFVGLVFLIGIAENDVPDDIPVSLATFDVAPPSVAPTQPSDVDAADAATRPQLAHLSSVAKSAASRDGRWFADETAGGTRPDAVH